MLREPFVPVPRIGRRISAQLLPRLQHAPVEGHQGPRIGGLCAWALDRFRVMILAESPAPPTSSFPAALSSSSGIAGLGLFLLDWNRQCNFFRRLVQHVLNNSAFSNKGTFPPLVDHVADSFPVLRRCRVRATCQNLPSPDRRFRSVEVNTPSLYTANFRRAIFLPIQYVFPCVKYWVIAGACQ